MAAVLSLLRIKNLALVEDLEWELTPGFTAITGETGAGKSIIIGALQLLLGERADKTLIRTGAEACTVEAIFTGEDFTALNARLEESGIEPRILVLEITETVLMADYELASRRLQELKTKYDPKNFFRMNQNIRPLA